MANESDTLAERLKPSWEPMPRFSFWCRWFGCRPVDNDGIGYCGQCGDRWFDEQLPDRGLSDGE